jgi:hypothetical protein
MFVCLFVCLFVRSFIYLGSRLCSVHTEKSNKMQQCIKIYYSIFIWSSTCFGRHTAHHQEPKTAPAASGSAYVEGCWMCGCWTLSGRFIIPYLYEAQHVSGDTPPIIRNVKLHYQPLVLHTWRVVGRVVAGRCQAEPDSVQQPHVQQPSTYAKPEAASAVLGSWWWAVCRPKHVEFHINME